MIVIIVMMMREGRREREGGREGGRAGGIEAEVWRRVAIALHFGGFYLVKAAREECHCTSFEKIIQYLGDTS